MDALRGLAALAVVLWHWQHFQLLGTERLTWLWAVDASPLDHSHQPFYFVFRLFYDHGLLAVALFFLISGFIFFWLYADRVEDKTISIGQFWVLRITRLYPLHLVTLAFVAILQWVFYRRTGQYFVYSVNDLRHFILGLLFFQTNGAGAAFNGPAWSITVELVVYGVFCAAAWMGVLRHTIAPLLIFVLGLVFYAKHQNIAMGICGFFEGGFVYNVFSWARRSRLRGKVLCVTVVVSVFGWLLALADSYGLSLPHNDLPTGIVPPSGLMPRLCVSYLLFPLTVLALALHENTTAIKYRYLSWLGQISYSSYLLHFPLQVIFALAVVAGFVPLWAKGSDAFLLVYLAILIAISLLSFRYFEAPVQKMLRRQWENLKSPSRHSAKPHGDALDVPVPR